MSFVEGQRSMRDRLSIMFTQWASMHPDPVVADELWQFVYKVREVSLLEDEKGRTIHVD